jgi:hypothetical protein
MPRREIPPDPALSDLLINAGTALPNKCMRRTRRGRIILYENSLFNRSARARQFGSGRLYYYRDHYDHDSIPDQSIKAGVWPG